MQRKLKKGLGMLVNIEWRELLNYYFSFKMLSGVSNNVTRYQKLQLNASVVAEKKIYMFYS